MRLIGIEPTHAAPEATALSTELQALNFFVSQIQTQRYILYLFFMQISSKI